MIRKGDVVKTNLGQLGIAVCNTKDGSCSPWIVITNNSGDSVVLQWIEANAKKVTLKKSQLAPAIVRGYYQIRDRKLERLNDVSYAELNAGILD